MQFHVGDIVGIAGKPKQLFKVVAFQDDGWVYAARWIKSQARWSQTPALYPATQLFHEIEAGL